MHWQRVNNLTDVGLDLIPPHLYTASARADVITLVTALRVPGDTKRTLLLAWSRVTGVRLTQREVYGVITSAPLPEARR